MINITNLKHSFLNLDTFMQEILIFGWLIYKKAEKFKFLIVHVTEMTILKTTFLNFNRFKNKILILGCKT